MGMNVWPKPTSSLHPTKAAEVRCNILGHPKWQQDSTYNMRISFFSDWQAGREREESDSLDLICELAILSYQCKR